VRELTNRTGHPSDPERAHLVASVIVPAYRAAAHLRACVDSLCAQELSGPFEVIVVVSGDDDDDLSYAETLGEDPRLRVVVHRPRLSAALGRNLAVELARSDLFVFTDADVVAESGWLGQLVDAASQEVCVAGAVVNGTPFSRAGTAEYLVEFLDFHPGRPPKTIWHGATCNLAVPRELWARFGPFADASERISEVGSADTAFTLKAAAEGLLVFCAAARIRHMNRTRLRAVLVHQVGFGRTTAILARSNATFPYRTLVVQTWAAPLIVAARWFSLWRRLTVWRVGLSPTAIRLTGHLALALGAWGVGLFKENRAIQRGQA
jgi:glycosyltransferase involved in cell wall biosynthesis